ncbi:TPA: F-box protein [Legionella pneumophila]|nr:F-box protein [Legionella pneumophila]HAT8183423.1 F-box protein [Legionella pneumophila]
MQDKFELSDELLPLEIHYEIGQCFSNSDLLNFALTSKGHLTLFQAMLDVRKILLHVVRGEHETVKAMLEENIDLIYRKHKVTDCSGRTFNISAFEYALWALDKHMWTLMLECISKDKKGNEVLQILLGQYKNVSTKGVTYTLHGETITENHFDFENTIVKELQTQVNSINVPGEKNWGAINKQWREGVGGAQRLLPAHVVYEYCSDEPFHPMPKFTAQPKSSKQFYNWITRKDENWFDLNSKLGVDFAIYKGRHEGVQPAVSCAEVARPKTHRELIAIKALCKVRKEDFLNLKSRLEKQMTTHHARHRYK